MDSLPIRRIDHLVLDSADLTQALAFYARLPGAMISREPGRGVVRLGRQKLNIHSWPPTLSPLAAHPVPGGQEFCLAVTGDMAAMAQALRARDIAVDVTGASRALADPDGNRIELAQGPSGAGPTCSGLAGLTLPVRDMAACADFYRRLGAISPEDSGEACRVTFADGFLRLVPARGAPVGAGDFCLIAAIPIGPAYSFCAKVPGLRPETGILPRTGALGPLRSFYLRDPEGNLVEIAEYHAKA